MKTNYELQKKNALLILLFFTVSLMMAQNNNALPTERLVFSPNQANWDTAAKEIFTYTPSDEIAENRIFSYQGNNTFTDSRKETYTYNAAGKRTSFLIETWNSNTSSWLPILKEQEDFDMNGNVILDGSLTWNNNTSSWDTAMGTYRKDYTYDTDGKELSMTMRTYMNGAWEYDNRIFYNYDSNDYLISIIMQFLNSASAAWEDSYKEEYTLNNNGEWSEVKEYEWDGSSWINFGKIININWQNFPQREYSGYTRQEWDGSSWQNIERFSSTWHTNGESLQALYEQWNGSAWENDFRFIQDFDSFDNKILYERQNWDNNNWATDHGDRKTFTYDADSNIETEIVEINTLGTWYFNVKYLYSYLTTSLSQSQVTAYFNVFPNPFKDKVFVKTPFAGATINIFDIKGQKIHTNNLSDSGESMEIDLSSFEKGIYLLQIISQNGITTKKLLKN